MDVPIRGLLPSDGVASIANLRYTKRPKNVLAAERRKRFPGRCCLLRLGGFANGFLRG